MPAAKVQLTGGHFQDNEGNVLANGYLEFELNQDEQVTGSLAQICSGIKTTITLNSSGSVDTTAAQYMWPNDVLLPVNSYYNVTGYTSNGALAWGPNAQQVLSSPSPYNLDAWTPNQITNWTPQAVSPLLQTNEVNNVVQSLLDLHAGTNITLTDNGAGRVTIDASGGGTSLQGVTISTSTPRLGDTLRYNEYGDSKWDIVNGYPMTYVATSTLFGTGYDVSLTGAGTTPTTVGTQAAVAATGTEPSMQDSSKTAAGSTNAAVGMLWPNGGAAAIGFGTIRRWQARCRLNNTSSVRYWVGLSEFKSTIATSTWATDTPNMNYAAFRFSATTDTVIQAVAGTSNVAQTVASTGVSVDTTNTQLFEIVTDGTHIYYYINGALVATITTNMMPASTLVLGSIIGDNKNTATAMSLDVAHMIYTVK